MIDVRRGKARLFSSLATNSHEMATSPLELHSYTRCASIAFVKSPPVHGILKQFISWKGKIDEPNGYRLYANPENISFAQSIIILQRGSVESFLSM